MLEFGVSYKELERGENSDITDMANEFLTSSTEINLSIILIDNIFRKITVESFSVTLHLKRPSNHPSSC